MDDIDQLIEETLSTRADRYQAVFNKQRGKVTLIDWYKNKVRVFDW